MSSLEDQRSDGESGDGRREGRSRSDRAERGGKEPQADDRQRISHEADQVVAGDHLGSSVIGTDRVDDLQAAAVAERRRDPRQGRGDEQDRHGAKPLRDFHHRNAGHEQRQTQSHRRVALHPSAEEDTSDSHRKQPKNDGAADGVVGGMEPLAEKARKQGAIESNERHRPKHRDGGRHELPQDGSRDAEPWRKLKLGRAIRARENRLGSEPHQRNDEDQGSGLNDEGKPERPRRVLREKTRDEGPDGEPAEVRARHDERGVTSVVVPIELGEPGSSRPRCQTDGEPTQDPRHEQPRRAARHQEKGRRQDREQTGAECDGATSDLIGKAPEEQQSAEVADDISRVDQRENERREMKAVAVHGIKRRQERAAHEHHADHRRNRAHRRPPTHRTPAIAHGENLPGEKHRATPTRTVLPRA